MLTSRVAKANIRPFEAGGHKCLARDHLHHDPRGRERELASQLPGLEKKNQCQTKGKTQFHDSGRVFFQKYFVMLHLSVDSVQKRLMM